KYVRNYSKIIFYFSKTSSRPYSSRRKKKYDYTTTTITYLLVQQSYNKIVLRWHLQIYQCNIFNLLKKSQPYTSNLQEMIVNQQYSIDYSLNNITQPPFATFFFNTKFSTCTNYVTFYSISPIILLFSGGVQFSIQGQINGKKKLYVKSRKKVSWKNLNSDTNEKIINISTEYNIIIMTMIKSQIMMKNSMLLKNQQIINHSFIISNGIYSFFYSLKNKKNVKFNNNFLIKNDTTKYFPFSNLQESIINWWDKCILYKIFHKKFTPLFKGRKNSFFDLSSLVKQIFNSDKQLNLNKTLIKIKNTKFINR
uniref:Uncharacterized protein n=1 Tax=Strongyloides stercoralis TaxID=6248 RepID=A0AAF5DTK1_STRER